MKNWKNGIDGLCMGVKLGWAGPLILVVPYISDREPRTSSFTQCPRTLHVPLPCIGERMACCQSGNRVRCTLFVGPRRYSQIDYLLNICVHVDKSPPHSIIHNSWSYIRALRASESDPKSENDNCNNFRIGDEARWSIGDNHRRRQRILFLRLQEEESPAVPVAYRRVLWHTRRLQYQRRTR